MALEKRHPVLVFVLSLVTFGIYGLYWVYKTKEGIVELGDDIPTFILMFIPIVNIFFEYKYSKALAKHVSGDKEYKWLWFIIWLLIPIFALPIFQYEINRYLENK